MEKLTIREIATKAGVSIATVSRAINPSTSRFVKRSTRDRVLKVVKKVNYLPSPVAKGLATGKSTNIVIFLGTRYSSLFYSDYYMKLLSGVMEVLENTPYNLIIRMLKHGESDFELDKVMRGMDIAAGIACDIVGVLQVSLTGLQTASIPVVVLNRAARVRGATFFDCNNFKAAYDAVKYLIRLGHRKIAIINGTHYAKYAIDRFEGYKKALIDSSIPVNDAYIFKGDFDEITGIKGLGRFMRLEDRPSAIFCANDEIAIGAFMELEKLGLRCPRDVSIIGFDGIDAGQYLVPKLATMRQPIYEMSKAAAKGLLNALDGGGTMGDIRIFNAQLMEGGTCAKPQPRSLK
jgi:LacI family transcriptional regulator